MCVCVCVCVCARVCMCVAHCLHPPPPHTHSHIHRMFEEVDVSGDQKVDYKEFVTILKTMDRNLKNLPATAQVASQQVST